jgi:hypothetical protein
VLTSTVGAASCISGSIVSPVFGFRATIMILAGLCLAR